MINNDDDQSMKHCHSCILSSFFTTKMAVGVGQVDSSLLALGLALEKGETKQRDVANTSKMRMTDRRQCL